MQKKDNVGLCKAPKESVYHMEVSYERQGNKAVQTLNGGPKSVLGKLKVSGPGALTDRYPSPVVWILPLKVPRSKLYKNSTEWKMSRICDKMTDTLSELSQWPSCSISLLGGYVIVCETE